MNCEPGMLSLYKRKNFDLLGLDGKPDSVWPEVQDFAFVKGL